MKKILALFALLMLFCLTLPCSALDEYHEYSYSSEDIGERAASERWDELIDALPEELHGEVGEIDPLNPSGSIEKLRGASSLPYWADKILAEVKEALPSVLSSLAPLLSVILLTAAVTFVLPESPRVVEAFMLCAKLSASVIVICETSRILSSVSSHLGKLCSVMNLFVPVMEAVTLALGNITEQSVHSAAVTLGVTLIGNFNTYLLTPLVSALFSLSAVSLLSGDMGLGCAVSSFRKFVNRMWQICAIFFSFLLGIQSILAKGTDNLAAKGVKFAIGSFVPVAGGMLSEAYGTLREGLSFVRGVCGVGGIVVLLLLTLPALIPVVMYKLSIFIAKTASELLKCDVLTPILTEVGGIVDFLIGIMLSVELMFMLSVLLFTKSW